MSKKSKLAKIDKQEKKVSRSEKLLMWLGNRLGVQVRKTDTKVPSFVYDPRPTIRKPLFDYVNLFEVATTSWVLRRAFNAKIQEATRNRWKILAKFKYKCSNEKCRKEFSITPKDNKCDACSSEVKLPSQEQYLKAVGLIETPNPDYRFDDLVRSSMFYDCSLDDYYWYIPLREVPKFKEGKIVINENKEAEYEQEPSEVYIEDARFIFPISDEYGHLGGYQYYCNNCYGKGQYLGQDQPVVDILPDTNEEEKQRLMVCSTCGRAMSQTAYVQEINGQIVARFIKEEIVHGSSSAVKPALFGMSKIISVWKVVQTVAAMDDYNWEVYSEGKVGSIIGFPGEDQLEVDEKKTAIEAELKKLDGQDIQSGRYKNSKKIRTLFLGLKEGQKPERIPIMENLKDMQSLEFYRVYLDAIGEMYGVTPKFEPTSEGKGSRLRIQVDPRATKELQNNFSDLWNSDVFPKFGITDWVLAFNPTEEKDELGEAQTLQTKMAAVLTATRAGLEVNVSEDGKVTIQGEAKIIDTEGGFGSRVGEPPRDMVGKPENWDYGAATRTSGERRDLELMAKALGVRQPYAPTKKAEDIFDEINSVTKWAIKQVKSGRRKATVIKEALAKAEYIFEKNTQSLISLAKAKASRRVGKDIELNSEYVNRLNRYMKDDLEDYRVILTDALSTKQLKKISKSEEAARLPVSWYEVSEVEILGKTFALNNDREDVYVTIDGKNVESTKETTVNLNYAISNLMDTILGYISDNLKNDNLDSEVFSKKRKLTVRNLRRDYNSQLLVDISNYFDDIGEKELATKIDYLRNKLSQIKPDKQEVQGRI